MAGNRQVIKQMPQRPLTGASTARDTVVSPTSEAFVDAMRSLRKLEEMRAEIASTIQQHLDVDSQSESVEDLIEALTRLFSSSASAPADAPTAGKVGIIAIHPDTGLAFPAQVPVKFNRNRSTPDEFVRVHFGSYLQNHLLYSEDLRLADQQLYDALRAQARRLGTAPTRYFQQLGILTKEDLAYPKPEFEKQATFLNMVRLKIGAMRRQHRAAEIQSRLSSRDTF